MVIAQCRSHRWVLFLIIEKRIYCIQFQNIEAVAAIWLIDARVDQLFSTTGKLKSVLDFSFSSTLPIVTNTSIDILFEQSI